MCNEIVGVNGDEGTPVPIPNTVVKLVYGDNTWLATAREDNSTPTPADRRSARYSSIAQLVEHAAVNRRVVGSSPTGGATSERTLLRSDFSYAKNQSHVPSFLLFRKKARSARLFACKRTHNGLLSLPPFCDTGAFGAQISERFISSAPE